jgi:hypothetical protein
MNPALRQAKTKLDPSPKSGSTYKQYINESVAQRLSWKVYSRSGIEIFRLL